MSLLTSVTANTLGTLTTQAKGFNTAGNTAASMLNSYSDVRATLKGMTGGAVTLPLASQTSLGSFLNKINGVGESAKTILNILGLSATAGNSAHLQASSNDYERGSFRWLEMETTPDSFATSDSVLLFASDPICNTANELVPIGLCQSFQFSIGLSVVPFKELRCEENMIYPTKAQPGNMSISRLCGDYSNLVTRLHIQPGWSFSSHSEKFKPLFGILAIFANPSREATITSLYFERCAITNASLGVQAGNFQIADTVNIMFGRCITIGEDTTNESYRQLLNESKNNAGKEGNTTVTDSKGNTSTVNLVGDAATDAKTMQKVVSEKGTVTVAEKTTTANDKG